MAENQYTEDNIRSLDWKEHIRLRPGMYIGKLGDGAAAEVIGFFWLPRNGKKAGVIYITRPCW